MNNEALTIAINAYITKIQASYAAYYARCVADRDVDQAFADSQIKLFNESFRVDFGQSYAKIIKDGSVYGFIVLKAGQFKVGDVLKAASWKAPAKNFARGNVFTGVSNVQWTGA
jgi:hypothetical protein